MVGIAVTAICTGPHQVELFPGRELSTHLICTRIVVTKDRGFLSRISPPAKRAALVVMVVMFCEAVRTGMEGMSKLGVSYHRLAFKLQPFSPFCTSNVNDSSSAIPRISTWGSTLALFPPAPMRRLSCGLAGSYRDVDARVSTIYAHLSSSCILSICGFHLSILFGGSCQRFV